MDEELYEWLKEHFHKDNHPKYRHLFDEWIANLHLGQIVGFRKQMFNEKNHILV